MKLLQAKDDFADVASDFGYRRRAPPAKAVKVDAGMLAIAQIGSEEAVDTRSEFDDVGVGSA